LSDGMPLAKTDLDRVHGVRNRLSTSSEMRRFHTFAPVPTLADRRSWPGAMAGRPVEPLAVSQPPFVAVIWALVENDRVAAARQLLARLPDQPKYAQLRRLLQPPRTARSARGETDIDRAADYAWIRDHGREHLGQWVAVHGGALIATAPTLRQLRQQLGRTEVGARPLLHHIR
jgi:hypothetical protein